MRSFDFLFIKHLPELNFKSSVNRWRNPMRRNIPQPVEAGGFEGGAWVEATSNGTADEGSALFFEQGQHLFLFRHQRIDARGFAVEVVGDQALGFRPGKVWNARNKSSIDLQAN